MSDSFATIMSLKANNEAKLANSRIDNLPKGINLKGTVATVSDLPASATNGDAYTVTADNNNEYVKTSSGWIKLGPDSINASSIDSTGASASQVLTADGSGGASWQSASGGTTLNQYVLDMGSNPSLTTLYKMYDIFNYAKGHISMHLTNGINAPCNVYMSNTRTMVFSCVQVLTSSLLIITGATNYSSVSYQTASISTSGTVTISTGSGSSFFKNATITYWNNTEI